MADHETYVPIYVSYGGNDVEAAVKLLKAGVKEATEKGVPLYFNAFIGKPEIPPPPPGND